MRKTLVATLLKFEITILSFEIMVFKIPIFETNSSYPFHITTELIVELANISWFSYLSKFNKRGPGVLLQIQRFSFK